MRHHLAVRSPFCCSRLNASAASETHPPFVNPAPDLDTKPWQNSPIHSRRWLNHKLLTLWREHYLTNTNTIHTTIDLIPLVKLSIHTVNNSSHLIQHQLNLRGQSALTPPKTTKSSSALLFSWMATWTASTVLKSLTTATMMYTCRIKSKSLFPCHQLIINSSSKAAQTSSNTSLSKDTITHVQMATTLTTRATPTPPHRRRRPVVEAPRRYQQWRSEEEEAGYWASLVFATMIKRKRRPHHRPLYDQTPIPHSPVKRAILSPPPHTLHPPHRHPTHQRRRESPSTTQSPSTPFPIPPPSPIHNAVKCTLPHSKFVRIRLGIRRSTDMICMIGGIVVRSGRWVFVWLRGIWSILLIPFRKEGWFRLREKGAKVVAYLIEFCIIR